MNKPISYEISVPAPLSAVWDAWTSFNEKESGSLEKGESQRLSFKVKKLFIQGEEYQSEIG